MPWDSQGGQWGVVPHQLCSASQAEGTQCLEGFTVIKYTKIAILFTPVIPPTAAFIVTVLSDKSAISSV